MKKKTSTGQKNMCPLLKTADPQKDRRMLLTFDNGERRVINLRDFSMRDPVFKTIMEDPEAFLNFTLAGSAIYWGSDMEFCLDYEFLYKASDPYTDKGA
jgi:hypothetical protein